MLGPGSDRAFIYIEMGSTVKGLEQALADLEHAGVGSRRPDALRSYLRLVRPVARPSGSLCTSTLSCCSHRTEGVEGQVRELKVRDSENVVLVGEELLRKHRARLGAEERATQPMMALLVPRCRSRQHSNERTGQQCCSKAVWWFSPASLTAC